MKRRIGKLETHLHSAREPFSYKPWTGYEHRTAEDMSDEELIEYINETFEVVVEVTGMEAADEEIARRNLLQEGETLPYIIDNIVILSGKTREERREAARRIAETLEGFDIEVPPFVRSVASKESSD